MMAMAILALVLGAAVTGTSWTMSRISARSDRAWAAELARSVLDEYRITGNTALARGAEPPGYRWRLDERPGEGGLIEVTVTAWRSRARNESVQLSYLRSPPQ